jgi:hypothetical protein
MLAEFYLIKMFSFQKNKKHLNDLNQIRKTRNSKQTFLNKLNNNKNIEFGMESWYKRAKIHARECK